MLRYRHNGAGVAALSSSQRRVSGSSGSGGRGRRRHGGPRRASDDGLDEQPFDGRGGRTLGGRVAGRHHTSQGEETQLGR